MPGFAGETANLAVVLKLDDSQFSGKLSRAQGQLAGFGGGLSRVGRGVGQVGTGLSKLATVASVAAVGGLAAVVSTAVSFEDAFAGVRKTVDATDEELDTLMETLRGMAREIPISFEELSAIGEQAGALGIATASIDEFTRTVALLGETTDVTTDQAATSLGVLANVLHLTEDDFDNFGSALVDLGNKGASTESQILAIAERSGAGAALIGVAADQTLGWASAAANLGIEVEAGGSALQKFFVESLKNLQDDDTLAVMAETAGTTSAAFKKAFERDASGALATFIRGLGKLDDASKLNVLDNLGFSDIRITRLLLGLAGDTDNLTDSLLISNEAWAANTALQTEAAKRFETTRSKLDLVVSNLRDVGYIIGREVLPIVADLSTEFVDFLNEPGTQTAIRDFAEGLAGGIRGFVKELQGTDFSGLLSGLQFAADAAKAAFSAFRSLPPDIQAILVGAFALNKVTGGAIGDIVKGVAGIGLGGIGLLRGSRLNPLFVTVTNQIPGAGGGPGGGIFGGFGGKGFWAGASRIFAGLFVAELASQLITGENLFDNLIAPIPDSRRIGGRIEKPSDSKPVPVDVVRSKLFGNVADIAGLTEKGGAFASLPSWLKGWILNTGNVPRPTLPNTALPMGAGGVGQLPDTAMLPLLREIARNTAPLPPIFTRAEQASQRTHRAVSDAKFAQMAGLASVRSAIERKQFRSDVTANVTVNTYVSGTMFSRQQSITRLAAGFRGGIPEGPG